MTRGDDERFTWSVFWISRRKTRAMTQKVSQNRESLTLAAFVLSITFMWIKDAFEAVLLYCSAVYTEYRQETGLLGQNEGLFGPYFILVLAFGGQTMDQTAVSNCVDGVGRRVLLEKSLVLVQLFHRVPLRKVLYCDSLWFWKAVLRFPESMVLESSTQIPGGGGTLGCRAVCRLECLLL